MICVDLRFPIVGNTLPTDHGYALYAAVSRVVGAVGHELDAAGIHPVRGVPTGDGTLALTERSAVRIRTPVEHIATWLRLSGKRLDVAGHPIRLGVPRTLALRPAPTLHSPLVTIKGFEQPQTFLEAARRQLEALGIRGQVAIPVRESGAHAGEPMRRVLRIKDKTVVGFAVAVGELTAAGSLTLQEHGLGGRRRMGCGVFSPADFRGPHG